MNIKKLADNQYVRYMPDEYFELKAKIHDRLLDLIELYRSRMPVIAAGGDELPFIVRHSQGDHWDLMVIQPIGSLGQHFSKLHAERRRQAG